MAFVSIAPDPRLAPLVSCYWRLDGLLAGQTYVATPKRHLELVVNLGAPQLAGESRDSGTRVYSTCWLTVFRERPLFLTPTGSSRMFGVRFNDFATPDWLSCCRNGWSRSTDLSDAAVTAELVHVLAPCDCIAEAAAEFDAYFLARQRQAPASSKLTRAIRRCDADERLRPGEIIRAAAGEPHRVRALAKQAGGISLRRFARLARLDRALVQLARPEDRIADVAQTAGYYDEAHMTNDFASLCGITPGRYRLAHPAGGLLPHHLYLC